MFYLIFSNLKLNIVGIIIAVLFGLIGFSIGTFKMPDSNRFEVTKKTGGLNIDEVIIRFIKFKQKKNRIYLYTKEGKDNESK